MRKQSFFKKILAIIILLGVCFSCIKDTDFEQSDTLVITPIMEVNLVKAQETPDSFLDASGSEVPFISDLVVLEVFTSDFIVENLIKAELVFEITNSINKAFQIKMDFYDTADTLQHSFSIDIDNSPTNSPLITEYVEVFENMSLLALKSTSKLDITISLASSPTGSVLTPDSEGSIRLTSKGVFYLKISS